MPSHYLNQCWNIVNWTLGTNVSEILLKFIHFHSRKCIWKYWSSCLGLNVLTLESPESEPWNYILNAISFRGQRSTCYLSGTLSMVDGDKYWQSLDSKSDSQCKTAMVKDLPATRGTSHTGLKWNIVKKIVAQILFQMIRSCHNLAHVTTAELSWHVQNCDMIWSSFFFTLEQHIFYKLWIMSS